jgi:hypothetical protein
VKVPIAVGVVAVGRLAVAEFVKSSFAEAVTADATFVIAAAVADVGILAATSIVVIAETAAATFTIAAAVVDVGRLAATAIRVFLDGKATSAFPDKSIQKLFASSQHPGTVRNRACFLDGKKAPPELIRL